MHKIGIWYKIAVLSVLCVANFYYFSEHSRMKYRASEIVEYQKQVKDLQTWMEKCDVKCFKEQQKLFENTDSIKRCIKDIGQRSHVTDLQFRFNEVREIEIKFRTEQEQWAYKFMEDLYFNLPGLTQFLSIKMNSNDCITVVMCKLRVTNVNVSLSDVHIHSAKYVSPRVCLFAPVQHHKLMCVIPNKTAFIDRNWYNAEDTIDEYSIQNIGLSYIRLRKDNTSTVIQLGEVW